MTFAYQGINCGYQVRPQGGLCRNWRKAKLFPLLPPRSTECAGASFRSSDRRVGGPQEWIRQNENVMTGTAVDLKSLTQQTGMTKQYVRSLVAFALCLAPGTRMLWRWCDWRRLESLPARFSTESKRSIRAGRFKLG